MKSRRKKNRKPENADELVAMIGDGSWVLWHRSARCGGDWHTFVLQAPEEIRSKKSVYYGGWNGERIARTSDLGILADKEPEIYAQLLDECPKIEWKHDE